MKYVAFNYWCVLHYYFLNIDASIGIFYYLF